MSTNPLVGSPDSASAPAKPKPCTSPRKKVRIQRRSSRFTKNAVSISSRLSVPEIKERIRRAVEELRSGSAGVLLFTDMPGGTPSNLAFPAVKDAAEVEMVSGLNLYMLVCAFSHRERLPLPELVEKVITDGQKSIRDIRLMLLSRAR